MNSHSFRIFAICLSLTSNLAVQAQSDRVPADRIDGPPIVSAKAWSILDAKTGKLLWGFNETEARPIASTTKIMTAWIVLQMAERVPKVMEEEITFSEKANKTIGTSSKLLPSDRVLTKDLLYGLLLPSGNDAAVALAEHFGPRTIPMKAEPPKTTVADTTSDFVAEMNREAKRLDLKELQYEDPHGLSRNNLSSTRNLAMLARAAFQNETFRKYVNTRKHTCTVTGADGKPREMTWTNTNRLLEIEGFDGIKTGTTTPAGNCLVSSGHRGEDHLIIAVLGSTSADGRYVDTRNLFQWAWRERAAKSGK
jgi:serine-type D-Ala-D-Ala carboxypeptidase (penicillin-binding protein 5/6)